MCADCDIMLTEMERELLYLTYQQRRAPSSSRPSRHLDTEGSGAGQNFKSSLRKLALTQKMKQYVCGDIRGKILKRIFAPNCKFNEMFFDFLIIDIL